MPGFGHGIGIVRGGLPERGSRYLIPGGLTPLLYAARDGRLESARILVAAGADVKQTDPNGITPLLMAITNNHMDVARFLIDRGSDVNVVDWYGRTPLWAAVETRNMDVDNAEPFENGVDRKPVLELIQYLLEKGADPNTRTKETPPIRRQMLRVTGSLAWVDFTGQSPFLTAALAGDLAVMQLLLDWGADPYVATFGGTTPLMAAAGVNWVVDQTFHEGPKALLDAVKLCFELGMDVNAVNSMGITAVHGRGQSRIRRHHPVPGRQRREARRQGQGRPHAAELGGRRLPRDPSGKTETDVDRADQEADGKRGSGQTMTGTCQPRNHERTKRTVRFSCVRVFVANFVAVAILVLAMPAGQAQSAGQGTAAPSAPPASSASRLPLRPRRPRSSSSTVSPVTTSGRRSAASRSTRWTSTTSGPAPRRGRRSSARFEPG